MASTCFTPSPPWAPLKHTRSAPATDASSSNWAGLDRHERRAADLENTQGWMHRCRSRCSENRLLPALRENSKGEMDHSTISASLLQLLAFWRNLFKIVEDRAGIR
eukprot:500092-Pelagomonas_calceolata.AAC.4